MALLGYPIEAWDAVGTLLGYPIEAWDAVGTLLGYPIEAWDARAELPVFSFFNDSYKKFLA